MKLSQLARGRAGVKTQNSVMSMPRPCFGHIPEVPDPGWTPGCRHHTHVPGLWGAPNSFSFKRPGVYNPELYTTRGHYPEETDPLSGLSMVILGRGLPLWLKQAGTAAASRL